MKKNILLSCYLNMNLGDDLFIYTVKELCPDVRFVCLLADLSKREYLEKNHIETLYYHPIKRKIDKVFYYLFNKTPFMQNMLINFDSTIILGGSLFIENPEWKKRKYMYSILRACSKQIDIIGANFGPYETQDFLESYTKLFASMNNITFRDTYSKSCFPTLNNIKVYPDFIFNFPHKFFEMKKKRIGFSIIDCASRKNLKQYTHVYEQFIIELVEYFENKGYEIMFFSFCQPENDDVAIKRIKEKKSNIQFVLYEGDIQQILSEIMQCEYMVSTRFHSMILGWLYDIKTLPIVYSEKAKNVISDIDSEINYFEISKLTEQDFDIEIENTFSLLKNKNSIITEAKKHFACINNL